LKKTALAPSMNSHCPAKEHNPPTFIATLASIKNTSYIT
jgi:hypothetical protein